MTTIGCVLSGWITAVVVVLVACVVSYVHTKRVIRRERERR